MTNSEARKRQQEAARTTHAPLSQPHSPEAHFDPTGALGGSQGVEAIRFWLKVRKTPTCWLWMAGTGGGGYGQFQSDRRSVPAHRWSFEALRGPIADELVLDHLCRVRRCVNPDHLEPVPNALNVLRGIGITAINKRKTHCKRGHEFTPENTYSPPSKPTGRICRICMSDRARRAGRRPMACEVCGKEISGKSRAKHFRTMHASQGQLAPTTTETGDES